MSLLLNRHRTSYGIYLFDRKETGFFKKSKMKDLTCADTGGSEKIRFVRKKKKLLITNQLVSGKITKIFIFLFLCNM